MKHADRGKSRNVRGGGRIRAVVVDDHAAIRDFLYTSLRAQGRVDIVGAAHNGRQALEAVASLCPDFVVMDVSMPEMDGLEATRAIKAEASPPRILLVSLEPGSERKKAASLAGADAFCDKAHFQAEIGGLLDELFPQA